MLMVHIEDALRRVPVELLSVVRQVYWNELTPAEAALALGIPLNTVYSRLRRAKARLRDDELLAAIARV